MIGEAPNVQSLSKVVLVCWFGYVGWWIVGPISHETFTWLVAFWLAKTLYDVPMYLTFWLYQRWTR